jgi:hypothetical protein
MKTFTARSNTASLRDALRECVEQTRWFLLDGRAAPHATVAFASHTDAARQLRDAFAEMGWPAMGGRAAALRAPEHHGAASLEEEWGTSDAAESDVPYVPFVHVTSVLLDDEHGRIGAFATWPPPATHAHLIFASGGAEAALTRVDSIGAGPNACAYLAEGHELFCGAELLPNGGAVSLALPQGEEEEEDDRGMELTVATVGEIELARFECNAAATAQLFHPMGDATAPANVRAVEELQRHLLRGIEADADAAAESDEADYYSDSLFGAPDLEVLDRGAYAAENAVETAAIEGDKNGDEEEISSSTVQTMLLDLDFHLAPHAERRHVFETPSERLLLRRVLEEGELFGVIANRNCDVGLGCFATISELELEGEGSAARFAATLTGAPQRFRLHRTWIEPRTFGVQAGELSVLPK